MHVNAYAKDKFLHTDKQCGPRSDCSLRSSQVHTVFYRDVLKGPTPDDRKSYAPVITGYSGCYGKQNITPVGAKERA